MRTAVREKNDRFKSYFVFQAKRCGVGSIDKDVGKLLYNIATKLKTQIKNHQAMIVEYIVQKKITSEIQLNGKKGVQISQNLKLYGQLPLSEFFRIITVTVLYADQTFKAYCTIYLLKNKSHQIISSTMYILLKLET